MVKQELFHTLRGQGQSGEPAWSAIDHILCSDAADFRDATHQELALLIDFVARVALAAYEDKAELLGERQRVRLDFFKKCGWHPDDAVHAVNAREFQDIAHKVEDIIRHVAAAHNAARTVPGDGPAALDEPGVFRNPTTAPFLRTPTLRPSDRLQCIHWAADLLSRWSDIHLGTVLVRGQCPARGIEALRVLDLLGTIHRNCLSHSPSWLAMFGSEWSSGIQRLLQHVRDDYKKSVARELNADPSFNADVQRLVLLDPEAAVTCHIVEAVTMAADLVGRTGTAEDLGRALDTYSGLFRSGEQTHELDLETAEDFFLPEHIRHRWPRSIPDVEEVARAWALSHLARSGHIPKTEDVFLWNVENTVLLIKIPSRSFSPGEHPKGRALALAARRRDRLLTWLVLPSSVSDNYAGAYFHTIAVRKMFRNLRLLCDDKALQEDVSRLVATASELALIGGGAAAVHALARQVFPEISDSILTGLTALIGAAIGRWGRVRKIDTRERPPG